ncbi:MAG: hypothetical protein ACK5S6_05375, partial [bacterium]
MATETRGSNPYISHLRITQRTTRFQVPTDYVDGAGNRLFQNVDCPPGIECEITPYVTETIKAPASPHRFPLKAFYQEGVNQLEAKANRTEQEQAGLDRLKAFVASPDVIWAEDILAEAGVSESLKEMWAESFSDVLDIFAEWKEGAEASVAGLPVKILPMDWECRVPVESNKSVNVNIGLYRTKKVDGKVVVDESIMPTQYVLSFEDNATKVARETREANLKQNIAELTGQIDGLTAEIAALPDGTAKTAKIAQKQGVESDKANKVRDLAASKAITKGLISQLIVLPSIQQSLPKL